MSWAASWELFLAAAENGQLMESALGLETADIRGVLTLS